MINTEISPPTSPNFAPGSVGISTGLSGPPTSPNFAPGSVGISTGLSGPPTSPNFNDF